jgi:hypothetical protein
MQSKNISKQASLIFKESFIYQKDKRNYVFSATNFFKSKDSIFNLPAPFGFRFAQSSRVVKNLHLDFLKSQILRFTSSFLVARR